MIETRPGSLSDTVYDLLRRAIIEQGLQPGMRLPEDTVGEQFGVSRTIVRHALVRLENEGLVVTRRNRGAFVAEPSLEEARQIFDVRHVLEQQVVRAVVGRMPSVDLAELESHVRNEETLKGKNGPASIRLAGEFHIRLAGLSGNAVLARYVAELVTRCSLIMAMYGRTHSSDCTVDEHHRIIEALRAQDGEAAARIMDEHLGAVADRADFVRRDDSVEAVLSRYGRELAG